MRLWRVTHVKHLTTAWTGEGAKQYGGRWNSKGNAVVYTSENAALAILEQLAYVAPQNLDVFRLLTGTLADAYVTRLAPGDVPQGWDVHPHSDAAKIVGDAWINANSSVGLKVPSCLAPGYNVLLNPAHADFHRFQPDAEAKRIPLAERAPTI